MSLVDMFKTELDRAFDDNSLVTMIVTDNRLFEVRQTFHMDALITDKNIFYIQFLDNDIVINGNNSTIRYDTEEHGYILSKNNGAEIHFIFEAGE